MSLVGALNDTTDLPNSGDNDTESLDAPSTSPADRDEENEQDIQKLPYTKVHRGGGGAGDSPRGRLRSGAPEGVQLC